MQCPVLRRAAAIALLSLAAALPARAADRPRLVILVSIDQFRADYLTRFEDVYLPPSTGRGQVGGFRFLMERGAWHADTHHDHLPLATGPGHAVLLTGAPPCKSGIVGNDWWDHAKGRAVYCVEDETSTLVGAAGTGRGISAAPLRVTTLGDELKTATGGRAKVFGIAVKDRAAVLMAGHLADGVFWYEDASGRWITSRAFSRDGRLPAWLDRVNAASVPDFAFGKAWNPSVPESVLARAWDRDGRHADNPYGLGTRFPHVIGAGQPAPNGTSRRAFTFTPFANDYVLDTARQLIAEERLGQDDVPDILAVSLSSNDYIGHAYGPDSPEVLDCSVRTDRALSRFLNEAAALVPGGWRSLTVVVTADHGVAPNTAAAREAGVSGGTWREEEAVRAVDAALDSALGAADWVAGYSEPYLCLNRAALQQKGASAERAERLAVEALMRIPGIYSAYGRSAALAGQLPQTEVGRLVARSFHPKVSGDVLVVSSPGFLPRSTEKGASHGEPYVYDTRVPLLLAGAGVRPGVFTERASTLDIAPTLAFLLRIQAPSASEGRILGASLSAALPSPATARQPN